jgi:hypothetical protein
MRIPTVEQLEKRRTIIEADLVSKLEARDGLDVFPAPSRNHIAHGLRFHAVLRSEVFH